MSRLLPSLFTATAWFMAMAACTSQQAAPGNGRAPQRQDEKVDDGVKPEAKSAAQSQEQPQVGPASTSKEPVTPRAEVPTSTTPASDDGRAATANPASDAMPPVGETPITAGAIPKLEPQNPPAVQDQAATPVPASDTPKIDSVPQPVVAQPNPGGEAPVPEVGLGEGGLDAAKGRQCQRVSGNFKLKLAEGETYTPRSIVVKVTRTRGSSTTTSSCTGVLGVNEIAVPVSAPGMAAGSVARLYFPHIQLARHCLAHDETAPILGISFVTVAGAAREVRYDFDAKANSLKRAEPSGGASMWRWDEGALVKDDGEDACQKAAVAGSQASMACFTLTSDRLRFYTTLERDLTEGRYKLSANDRVKLEGAQGLVWPLLADQDEAKLWAEIMDDASGGQKTMALLRRTLEYPERNLEQLWQRLDQSLVAISITKLVHDSDSGTPANTLIKLQPGQSWRERLQIFGREVGGRFVVDTFALQGKKASLRPGDSGTILVGHFIEPLGFLGFQAATEIMGSLSTVGGEPVCTGDDLLCCERS